MFHELRKKVIKLYDDYSTIVSKTEFKETH